MTTSHRKRRLRRNLGGSTTADDPRFHEPYFHGPQQAEVRTSITLPERLFRAVLLGEVERLSKPENQSELERFFGHFFDPTVGEQERQQYVEAFQADPPRVVLGYPRTTGSWPVISITHTGEEELQEGGSFLGDHVGETLPGEHALGGEDQLYKGAIWQQVYSIYILSSHPDVTLYLYHFAKLCLFGAREALEAAGINAPTYSGGELNPEEILLPDNAFARVLTIRFSTMQTVPEVFNFRDSRRLRLTGVFGPDVVVDGLRGGVHPYAPGDEDDDA